MGQSKIRSLKETVVQTSIGFFLSLVLQLVLAQVYDMQTTLFDNIQITIWFTVLSLGRGYVVRRWMNKGDIKEGLVVFPEHDNKVVKSLCN